MYCFCGCRTDNVKRRTTPRGVVNVFLCEDHEDVDIFTEYKRPLAFG